MPVEAKEFVAKQLNLLWEPSAQYPADERTQRYHLSLIRQHTGWRFPTAHDKEEVEQWLRNKGALSVHTEEELLESAYARLQSLRIELPSEKELRRIVNAALNGFFQDLYHRVASRLSDPVRAKLDQLLIVAETESFSPFEKLKADPAEAGIDNLKKEVAKLQQLRAIGITAEEVACVPPKALHILSRRARNERAGEMREHPPQIRYTLMACLVHVRATEVTDDMTRMMLELIRKIDTLTERQLDRELLHDIKRVEGKMQILFRIAEAVVEDPEGTVREVSFHASKKRPCSIWSPSSRRVARSIACCTSFTCGTSTRATFVGCSRWCWKTSPSAATTVFSRWSKCSPSSSVTWG